MMPNLVGIIIVNGKLSLAANIEKNCVLGKEKILNDFVNSIQLNTKEHSNPRMQRSWGRIFFFMQKAEFS